MVWEFLPSLGPVIEVIEAVRSRDLIVPLAVKCDWIRRLLKTIKVKWNPVVVKPSVTKLRLNGRTMIH